MKKILVLMVACFIISGCAKTDTTDELTATHSNVAMTDLSSYESHTADDNEYLGDYIRYAKTEYDEAMMDYAMYKVGGYPVYAKSYDGGTEISSYTGNGYEYVIRLEAEPIFYWKWTDESIKKNVMSAIECGKNIYDSLQQKEEELLEQYKDDVFTDKWFLNGMRTVTAELEYFPTDMGQSWKVKLSEEQVEKIKDILHRVDINPDIDPYQSDFRYTLSLYDSLGDYIFVIAMDTDKTSMYVERGGCESSELNTMLNNIIQAMEDDNLETEG